MPAGLNKWNDQRRKSGFGRFDRWGLLVLSQEADENPGIRQQIGCLVAQATQARVPGRKCQALDGRGPTLQGCLELGFAQPSKVQSGRSPAQTPCVNNTSHEHGACHRGVSG